MTTKVQRPDIEAMDKLSPSEMYDLAVEADRGIGDSEAVEQWFARQIYGLIAWVVELEKQLKDLSKLEITFHPTTLEAFTLGFTDDYPSEEPK